MSVNRRQFIKAGSLALGSLAVHSLPLQARPAEDKATVYFTPEITTESLLRIYEKVCAPLQGRIAIKLHTGEPHGPNILPRDMVRALQARIPKSSIVECNVLYPSPRQTTEGHRETLRTNGWTFCPVDIMDADGEVSLPIPGGRHLREVAVGKNLLNYDSMLVLTHFKGHVMGGFGGSLKNIAIGCASGKTGKAQLHSDGTNLWAGGPLFMERMVEGGKAITTHFKGHMAYINVLRRMSVDCDCAGTSAAEPTAPDIGILASTDLLAVDQASVDMVYALPEQQRHDLVERIESRSGLRQLEYMETLGMGHARYDLVSLSRQEVMSCDVSFPCSPFAAACLPLSVSPLPQYPPESPARRSSAAGSRRPSRAPPAFSPGPCASIPCTPPTTPCAPAAAASLLNPAPAPTGISILWDRCSSSPPGSA